MIQARIFHINDSTAFQTDEVMMLVELWIEAGGQTRMRSPGHQAERNEGSQDPMDRHKGDLWKPAAD
jgi:hypothetical protein